MKIKEHICNSAIIIAVIWGGVFLVYAVKGIYPFGSKPLAWQDMSQITIPLYYYLYDVLHGDAAAFFSWQVGGGINMTGIWSELSLSSPFNLVLFFSKRDNLYNFVNLLILFKMIAMALAMYCFSNKYKIKSFYKIITSILYGCCSCVLIHYQIGFMLDIAILFPLLILGFYKLFDEGKRWLYVSMLSICLFINIYISIMVVIYIMTISGTYLYYCVEKDKQKERITLFATSTIYAILLGAIAWIPAFLCIMNSGRVGNGGVEGWIVLYLQALMADQTDNFSINFFFINTSFFVAIILMNIRNRKTDKVLNYHRCKAVLMVLSVMVPGIELLWHTGSRVSFPVRFAFIVTFAIAEYSMVCIEKYDMDESAEKTAKDRLANLAWSVIVVLSVILISHIAIYISKSVYLLIYTTMCLETIWIGLFIFLYKRYNGKFRLQIVSTLVLFEVFFNMYVWFAPSLLVSEPEVKYLETSSRLSLDLEKNNNALDKCKDYCGMFNSNYALVLNQSSIANYVHVIKGELQTLFSRLGYSITWTRLLDTGGTIFTDALLGIRNTVSADELDSTLYTKDDVISNKDVLWYDNNYVIPHVVEMNNSVIFNGNKFDYQNAIFSEISQNSSELIKKYKIEGPETEIYVENEMILYFYCDSIEEICTKVNGENVIIKNYIDDINLVYPATFNNGMVCLGLFDNEWVSIRFETSEGFDFSQIQVGLLDVMLLEEELYKLNDEYSKLEIETGKNDVKIKWTKDFGNYLFLPVNFDKGWNCTINNQKKNLVILMEGYIGIPLEEGENIIELKYIPEGTQIGGILTLIGVASCCLCYFLSKRKIGIITLIIEKALEYFYVVGWWLFVSFLYICPLIVYIYRIFVRIAWNM